MTLHRDLASILIVEDDPATAAAVRKLMEELAKTIVVAGTATQAMQYLREKKFDLIILDRILPDADGTNLMHNMKLEGIHSLVLMLTIKSEVEERIKGLEYGADDYLAKPYNNRELVLRAQKLLNRASSREGMLYAGDLRLSTKHRVVTRGDTSDVLTKSEYAILLYLIEHRGEVVANTELLEQIQYYDSQADKRTLNADLSSLQSKIERENLPQPIESSDDTAVRLVTQPTKK